MELSVYVAPRSTAMRRSTARPRCRGISLFSPPAGRTLRSALLLFLFVFLVDQLLLFGLFGGAHTDFVVAIEVDLAIDQHLLYLGVIGERKLIVDHQVGVLAYFDRAHAILDAELFGGVERDHRQGFGLAQPAVFDGLAIGKE